MASNEPKITGGPIAHALAHWLRQLMAESGSPDLVVAEIDKDGNPVRSFKLKNVKLLGVEAEDQSDTVESVRNLLADRAGLDDVEGLVGEVRGQVDELVPRVEELRAGAAEFVRHHDALYALNEERDRFGDDDWFAECDAAKEGIERAKERLRAALAAPARAGGAR